MLKFIFNLIVITYFTVCTVGFIIFNFLIGTAVIKFAFSLVFGGVKWLFGY